MLGDRVPAAAPVGRIEICRIERDPHDSAGRRHRPDLLVGEVPRVRPARLGPGVADDDGAAGRVDGVPEGRRGGVGEVDEHAAGLHLGDHFAAQGGQPAGGRFAARRVAQLVGVHPGEREVAGAEGGEARRQARVALQRLAVLDPRQQRDPAGGRRRPNLVRGRGEGAPLRMGVCRRPHGPEQGLGAGARAAVRQRGIDPCGQEHGIDAALSQAREVGVPCLPPGAQVDPVVDHAERGVHVAVEDDRGAVHQRSAAAERATNRAIPTASAVRSLNENRFPSVQASKASLASDAVSAAATPACRRSAGAQSSSMPAA